VGAEELDFEGGWWYLRVREVSVTLVRCAVVSLHVGLILPPPPDPYGTPWMRAYIPIIGLAACQLSVRPFNMNGIRLPVSRVCREMVRVAVVTCVFARSRAIER